MKKLPKPAQRKKQAPEVRTKPLPTTKPARRQRRTPAASAQASTSTLLSAEALLRCIFDNAPVATAIVGLDFSFKKVNASFCRFLGYSETELTRKRFPEITHPDDSAASRNGIKNLLAGKSTSFDQEKRYIRKNGDIIWGRVSVSIVGNKSGQPLHLVANIQDIHARKTAEVALQESEKRFQQITAAVTDYIYTVRVVDNRAVDTIHGPGCQAVTGYQPEDFAKDPFLWFRMVAPADQTMVERQARQILIGQESTAIEHRIIHKNGAERWVKNTFVPHHDIHGILTSYEGLIQDITERKQAEEALRLSEFRWKFAIEGAGDGLWDRDVTSNTVFYSRRWKEMLGYADNEITNDLVEWEKRIHPDDKPAVMAASKAHREGKSPSYLIEYRFLCKDGSWKWIRAQGMAVSQDAEGRPLRVIGRHTDISERKRTEEMVRQSEALFRSTFDEAPACTAIVGFDHVFQRVNAALCRFLGYTAEELQGKSFAQFTHPDDISKSIDHAWKMQSGEYSSLSFEKRYLNKTGNVIWGKVSANLIRDSVGQPLHLVTTIQDITEQKVAEKALRETRAILQVAMDQSPAGIAIADAPSGVLRYVNDAGLLMRGGDRADIVGQGGVDQYVASWRLLDLEGNPLKTDKIPMVRAIKHGETSSLEFIIRQATGDERTVLANAAPIKDEKGEVVAGVVVFVDTTETKKAEENLAQFFDLVPDMVCIASAEGYFVSLNSAWEHVLGYSKAELMAIPYTEFIHPDDHNATVNESASQLTGKAAYNFTNRYRAKNGAYRWFEWNGTAANKKGFVFAAARDITDHKQAEEAIRESELRYRTLANSGQGLIWTAGLDKKCNYFNQTWLAFTGRRLEQELGDGWTEGVHPDDLAQCVETYVTAFDRRERFSMDYRVRRHDGEYRWIQDDGSPRYDSQGNFLGYIGHCLDVTERKQADEKLRETQALYHSFVEQLPNPVFRKDREGRYLLVNPQFCKVKKLKPEDAIGKTPIEIANQESPRQGNQAQATKYAGEGADIHTLILKTGKIIESEEEYPGIDGNVQHMHVVRMPVFDATGEIIGTQGILFDITARKLAETALRESELTLRESQSIAGLGSYVLDIATGYWKSSPVLDQVFGMTSKNQRSVEEWVLSNHPDDQRMMADYFRDHVVGQHQPFNKEYRIIRQDNKAVRWVHGLGRLTFDDAGRPIAMRGTIQDITERRLAEEALRQSEDQFRTMFDLASIGIAQANPQTRQWLRVNRKMAEITGYSADEMLKMNVSAITHPDDEPADREAFQRVLRGEIPAYQMEKRYLRKDGTQTWVNVNVTVLRDATGQPIRSIAMIEDITARKQAEEALHASENRFRGLFELAVDGILIGSSDGRCIEMNQQLCVLVGRTRDELLGKQIDVLFTPEVLHETPLRWNLLNQGQPVKTVRPIKRPDGLDVIVEMHSKKMPDGGYQSFFHDVTAQHQAEAALRASEERFRDLLQNVSTVAVQGYRLDGTTSYWNRASELLYGYTAQEAIGCNLLDLIIPSEMQDGVRQAMRQMTETGQPIPASELSLKKKDGSRVAVFSSHAIVQLPGQSPELFCIDIDLTERKQAEVAIRESEEKFAKVFHDAPVWITITDLETGSYVDVNDETLHASGFTREEMIGHTAIGLGLVSAEDRDHVVQEVQEHGFLGGKEMAFRIKDGRTLYGWLKAELLVIGSRKCLLTVTIDVTDRKRAEEALRKQAAQHAAELEARVLERTAELEATNKELEAFSYSVSHDLRAPLRAIDGFSKILNTDFMARLDQEGQRVLGIICAEAKRMGLLIDDLLSFSRMNRLPMQTAEIDMTALTKTVFDDCEQQSQGRQLQFKLEPLPIAYGDLPMIRQVLMNLIANAIKYTRPKPLAEIEIGCYQQAGENVYYIKDNGVGFDQQYADKLFGVFQRLHTEEEFEGTGVGLALVQRVIHRHGGRAWAEAKVNQGATFFFTLPAVPTRA